jgi:hypothetical protein
MVTLTPSNFKQSALSKPGRKKAFKFTTNKLFKKVDSNPVKKAKPKPPNKSKSPGGSPGVPYRDLIE